jgi:hypothetical protein
MKTLIEKLLLRKRREMPNLKNRLKHIDKLLLSNKEKYLAGKDEAL